jgi:hypothetical protein
MFFGIIAGLLRFIRCPKQEKSAGLFGYFEDFMVFNPDSEVGIQISVITPPVPASV